MSYITNFLPTTAALADFKQKLEELKLSKYAYAEKSKNLRELFSEQEAAVLESVKLEKLDDTQAIEELLNKIESVQIVELTVAVPLKSDQVETISDRLHQILNKEVALRFTQDESILAGAIIGFNGRVSSHTLVEKLKSLSLS